MTPRSRRRVGFRIAASLLVLVVVLAGAEALARTLDAPQLPRWRVVDRPGMVLAGHPTRLWGLRPGRAFQGSAEVEINDLGLRGPSVGPKRGPRVLVLGDSSWFGHGVADGDTFPAQLGASLAGTEVINGGVPGYSTEQSLLLLDEVGWSLGPDLLVVGSLWSDNNYDGQPDRGLLARARVTTSPFAWSRAYVLLAIAVDRARGGSGAQVVDYTRASGQGAGPRRVPVREYAENLDRIAREATGRGVGVMLVAPANRERAGERRDGSPSWEVYFAAQAAVADHHGLPRVDLADVLRAAPPGDPLFVDVMHPSARGHALAAAAVASRLLAEGWPASRPIARGGPFDAAGLVDRSPVGAAGPESLQDNLDGG